MLGRDMDQPYTTLDINGDLFKVVVTTCAYAEYWDWLPFSF